MFSICISWKGILRNSCASVVFGILHPFYLIGFFVTRLTGARYRHWMANDMNIEVRLWQGTSGCQLFCSLTLVCLESGISSCHTSKKQFEKLMATFSLYRILHRNIFFHSWVCQFNRFVLQEKANRCTSVFESNTKIDIPTVPYDFGKT